MSKSIRSLLFLLCLTGAAGAQVTAAVAANLQFAFEEVKAAFQKKTGVEAKAVYGASGKLQSQIRSGAPFDVFVSADTEWPDSLVKSDHAVGTPRVYAYGRLVLWTNAGIDLSKGLATVSDPAVKKVAVGDPKVTVYGPAALRALEKAGLKDAALPKFVYGASITQVAQYVATGAAQIGFVAKSQMLAGPLSGKGTWVDLPSVDSIPQAAVVTRYGKDNNPKSAQALLDFLLGPEGRAILARHGYTFPK
jgi:molybdate transport system substrate-binding protein